MLSFLFFSWKVSDLFGKQQKELLLIQPLAMNKHSWLVNIWQVALVF